jgi:phage terminase small subunit
MDNQDPAKKRLTWKQLALVNALLTSEKMGIEAAGIQAGFNKSSAAQAASRALALPHVAAYYQAELAKRAERTGIDADYVLRRLAEIDQLDVLDILTEGGDLKPVHDWPKVWRQSISGVDISAIASGDTAAVLKKIKWPDKLRNLELIGKHVGVKAFSEQIEVTDSTGLAARMLAARERAKSAKAGGDD